MRIKTVTVTTTAQSLNTLLGETVIARRIIFSQKSNVYIGNSDVSSSNNGNVYPTSSVVVLDFDYKDDIGNNLFFVAGSSESLNLVVI